VSEQGRDGEFGPPHRFPPTRVEASPPLLLDLRREGFASVLWATGFRPDYSWLHLPVFDRKGEIRHEGGIVPDSPGLYRIGLNLLRRRKSSFIHGAEDDARDLTDHLVSYLRR
jgi:putative flavoprotein involved in K+ transport